MSRELGHSLPQSEASLPTPTAVIRYMAMGALVAWASLGAVECSRDKSAPAGTHNPESIVGNPSNSIEPLQEPVSDGFIIHIPINDRLITTPSTIDHASTV